jgi:hypothetical protein
MKAETQASRASARAEAFRRGTAKRPRSGEAGGRGRLVCPPPESGKAAIRQICTGCALLRPVLRSGVRLPREAPEGGVPGERSEAEPTVRRDRGRGAPSNRPVRVASRGGPANEREQKSSPYPGSTWRRRASATWMIWVSMATHRRQRNPEAKRNRTLSRALRVRKSSKSRRGVHLLDRQGETEKRLQSKGFSAVHGTKRRGRAYSKNVDEFGGFVRGFPQCGFRSRWIAQNARDSNEACEECLIVEHSAGTRGRLTGRPRGRAGEGTRRGARRPG